MTKQKLFEMEPNYPLLFEESFYQKLTRHLLKDEMIHKLGRELRFCSEWLCVTDYSNKGSNKNKVYTFSFFPFPNTYFGKENQSLVDLTREKPIKDIKNIPTTGYDQKHLDFSKKLRSSKTFNFSIILNLEEFNSLNSIEQLREFLLGYLQRLESFINISKDNNKTKYSFKNKLEVLNLHEKLEKGTNNLQSIAKNGKKKKLKELINLFMIINTGAFLTYVLDKTTFNLNYIGWVPDRDSIHNNEGDYTYELFGFLSQSFDKIDYFKFDAVKASTDRDKPQKQLIKIPDHISGIVADYDLKNKTFSSKKFQDAWHQIFKDNKHNINVYHLKPDNYDQFDFEKVDLST